MARLGMVMTVVLLVASVAGAADVANWQLNEGSGQRYACSVTGDQGYLGSSVNGDVCEPLWSTDTNDGSAYSLDFDGVNDFAYDDNRTDIDAISGPISMSADIKVDALTGRDNFIIINRTKGLYWKVYGGSAGDPTYRLNFFIEGPTGNAGLVNNIYYNVGTWYNVEAVYTGTELQIWVDGVMQTGTTAYSGGIKSGAVSSTQLGAYNSTTALFDGKIDNVHITPEPATLTLLATGGLLMLVRKRRQV